MARATAPTTWVERLVQELIDGAQDPMADVLAGWRTCCWRIDG